MGSSTSNIFFHTEEINFNLVNQAQLKTWINKSIILENKTLGELNFIFCSDNYLLQLNLEYLNHDTYTDVITFNYVDASIISGDIFISIDRVAENANLASIDFQKELSRVIIHGVLHLIGYDDKTEAEAQEIRAKEDFYLTLLP